MTINILLVAASACVLGACAGETPAENSADQLEAAAEQSTPEAENVLENGADAIREGNISDPAAVDAVLDAAGNAQALPAPPGRADQNGQ
jgi:hypothetical protein